MAWCSCRNRKLKRRLRKQRNSNSRLYRVARTGGRGRGRGPAAARPASRSRARRQQLDRDADRPSAPSPRGGSARRRAHVDGASGRGSACPRSRDRPVGRPRDTRRCPRQARRRGPGPAAQDAPTRRPAAKGDAPARPDLPVGDQPNLPKPVRRTSSARSGRVGGPTRWRSRSASAARPSTRARSTSRSSTSRGPRTRRRASAAIREAYGVARYLSEDFAGALTELQAYVRISGRNDQNHVIADCHRALGRDLDRIEEPARALLDDDRAPADRRAEAAIVLAAALGDAGRAEDGLEVLASDPRRTTRPRRRPPPAGPEPGRRPGAPQAVTGSGPTAARGAARCRRRRHVRGSRAARRARRGPT